MASRDAGASPLDRSIIGRLAAGDRSAERELARRFLAFNEHDARMLGNSIGRQDKELTVLVAQRMKSAAEAIGAVPLAQACEGIAATVTRGDWHSVVVAMADVRREVERLQAFLRTAYPES